MTLEELQKEKREIEKQIGKLVQEFESKFNCYAELRQNAGSILSAKPTELLRLMLRSTSDGTDKCLK